MLLDRSFQALAGRYTAHPDHDFKIGKLLHQGVLSGYLIFKLTGEDAACNIYDLIVNRPKDELVCLLALFIKYCQSLRGVDTIRCVLNDRHPYKRKLWSTGFIPRKHQNLLQAYWPKGPVNKGCTWLITLGDKDI